MALVVLCGRDADRRPRRGLGDRPAAARRAGSAGQVRPGGGQPGARHDLRGLHRQGDRHAWAASRPPGQPERAADLCAPRLPGGGGPAFLPARTGRPAGHIPRLLGQLAGASHGPGRLDPDPAAGQDPLSEARPDLDPQVPGGGDRLSDRAADEQGRGAGAVPQPHLLRRQRLWRRRRVADLFRQAGLWARPAGGGPARGPAQGPDPAGPDQRHARGAAPLAPGAGQYARRGMDHPPGGTGRPGLAAQADPRGAGGRRLWLCAGHGRGPGGADRRRRGAGPDRAADHRSGPAGHRPTGGARGGEPERAPRRGQPGRPGAARPGRRHSRPGRRDRPPRLGLQPRHPGPAPAGLVVQALHLRRRAGGRGQADRHPPGPAGAVRPLVARRLRRLSRPGDGGRRPGPLDQFGGRAAGRRGRRRQAGRDFPPLRPEQYSRLTEPLDRARSL